MWKNVGGYSKGVVAVLTAVLTSLAPYYGDRPWFVAVGAAVGAVAVVLVPNVPAAIGQAPEHQGAAMPHS